ncbi:trehalose synthase (Ccg-9) [Lineolata rhizophorae]|uniref:Trehalose synthase (Ccg-9) n=1 Tax=Lineolata rhizophorae TaxID=578093 RepID=A0A6A6NZA9_9PEZI|nr:trehalose synthase (Ccg-9) [Lineolata rhizophorae]
MSATDDLNLDFNAAVQRVHHRRKTWPATDLVDVETIRHEFKAASSGRQMKRMQRAQEEGHPVKLQPLFMGISAAESNSTHVDIGFASHDGTYSIDFAVHTLPSGRASFHNGTAMPEEQATQFADYFITKMHEYEEEHLYKFVAAGVPARLVKVIPQLPSRLWAELDVVPMVFERGLESDEEEQLGVDEEADSMARKALMFFGPNNLPRIQVGRRNEVEVDSNGHALISSVEQYRQSCTVETWEATMKIVDQLKKHGTKIAFFNTTPQGGGVALMRHALIRFLRLVGVNAKWYVPKPKPEVFRITKTNHNILQGVAAPSERLTLAQQDILNTWAHQNATRYWTQHGGPLASRGDGGADVIIIDDPQMPSLVTIAKQMDATRPVLFRSHIQVRADLVDAGNNPTAEVWDWLWHFARHADVFISHPVRAFVPACVPRAAVAYMPATTDWLDGLNKQLDPWDVSFYLAELNEQARNQHIPLLQYPARPFVAQIARFDPSKGIPDVLAAYAILRREHMRGWPAEKTPQLVVAGHGAVDDPDGTAILDQTLSAIDRQYADLADDIVVLRLGPSDQMLGAILQSARVALQLSTREGFEVKVSEALHKGVPIVATLAGGIPLQVEHGKSGFLVEPGDAKAVAGYLAQLFGDESLWERMSEYARTHVSDEVGTVGNALAWLYLCEKESRGEKVVPEGRWVVDMAREETGVEWTKGETRLSRNGTVTG